MSAASSVNTSMSARGASIEAAKKGAAVIKEIFAT